MELGARGNVEVTWDGSHVWAKEGQKRARRENRNQWGTSQGLARDLRQGRLQGINGGDPS